MHKSPGRAGSGGGLVLDKEYGKKKETLNQEKSKSKPSLQRKDSQYNVIMSMSELRESLKSTEKLYNLQKDVVVLKFCRDSPLGPCFFLFRASLSKLVPFAWFF